MRAQSYSSACEAHRQRGEPQLEDDLVGRRGDLVGTGEGGAGPLPVALPERQLGLPCGTHARGVVVGAERVAQSSARSDLGVGEPPPADQQVEPPEVDGEGEVRVDAPGEHGAADRVGVGPPPERQQRQRQLAAGQRGIGSVQPQALQVGEPSLGELDRLGGTTGEHVGLDEVVPRRADPLGVVALHGEIERLVQPAEPVVEVAEVALERSEDVQGVADLGRPSV